MSIKSEVLLYVATQGKDNFNFVLNNILELLSSKYNILFWKIDDIMQTIITRKEDYPCLKYDEYLFLIHDFIKWKEKYDIFYDDLLDSLSGNIEFVSNFIRIEEHIEDYVCNVHHQSFSDENENDKDCKISFFRRNHFEGLTVKIETNNDILNKHLLE